MRQATLGVNFNDMKEFVKMTPEKWIDEQLKVPSPNMLEKTLKDRKNWMDYVVGLGYDFKGDTVTIKSHDFQVAWFNHNLNNRTDYLKQRLAQVFSQIFVISRESEFIYHHADGQATFYDLLLRNTTGNFKDLLLGISLHPSMGIYLSHLNNSKAIPERNLFPDENYAREIMQLFTIGLHQLNIDGSLKLDTLGNPVPTYTQRDIKELAKVFTGLGPGKAGQFSKPDRPTFFGMDRWNIDFTYPMIMYEDWHEPGSKSFLNFTVPAGQKGMKDIEMAINHIFLHPNVGPFIGKQLIQKLVTSNPSPAYIKKVAETFNDNGKGVRGDMAAVFKAILMHPEARSCESLKYTSQGKLQEPLVRFFERIRNYKIIPDKNNRTYTSGVAVNQNIQDAKTVFNYYQPNYSPSGVLRSNNLLGPEFQLHNSSSSMDWARRTMSSDWLIYVHWSWYNFNKDFQQFYLLDLSEFNAYANDPEALVNQFDKRFTRGRLTERTRRLMKDVIVNTQNLNDKITNSLGVLLLSPQFNILK